MMWQSLQKPLTGNTFPLASPTDTMQLTSKLKSNLSAYGHGFKELPLPRAPASMAHEPLQ